MEIELRNLVKTYGDFHAVRDLSATLAPGEMLALLGPSGCGKTTTLRMLAGFIVPTSGRILFRGRDVTKLPPHRRDTGLVFQSYALFPHLSVAENIAFGLRRRGVAAAERKGRVSAMIRKLKLDGLDERLPRQLSGGQQQRVAVARALVISPAVLLLDEPFSNLDAKLRESTGLELRRIQQELGLTSIFVTHDQQEAMAIADRIAVMNAGSVEQIGSAADIYERPQSRFTAGFVGSANFLSADIEHEGQSEVCLRFGGGFKATMSIEEQKPPPGRTATMMIRPEHIRIATECEPGEYAKAVIEVISYQGPFAHVTTRLGTGEKLLIQIPGDRAGALRAGAEIPLRLDPRKIRLFPTIV